MGKKRKAGGQPFGHDEPSRAPKNDSKLRINTYEDVADFEDEFHINRDKISLNEGPAQKRQRRIEEEGRQRIAKTEKKLFLNAEPSIEEFMELSDEEVLAISPDVSDSEDDYEDAEESSNPIGKPSTLIRPSRPTEDSDSEASAAFEDDEDAGGWGASKKDYYNADAIETEADALEEEAEAKRLQQKQLQGMTEADFGFDEAEWLETGKDEGEEAIDEGRGKVLREVLPRLEITDAMGPEERSKILRLRYPEFEPLAKEFLELQLMYVDLKSAATQAESVPDDKRGRTKGSFDSEDEVTSFALVKFSSLATYLGALSFYFALLTSGQEEAKDRLSLMPPEELRDHAIMEILVQCRDLWHRAKDYILPESNELKNGGIETLNGLDDHETTTSPLPQTNGKSGDRLKKRKQKNSKAQEAESIVQAEAVAQRAERLRKTEEELAGLSALTERTGQPSNPIKTSRTTTKAQEDSDSDFGEQTTLTAYEAAEKDKRKKSLRFYTSQIAQKSNKRDAASRDAGGDADLPYRERLKDRQARLTAEAENRGQKPKHKDRSDALGEPSDEEDYAAAKKLRDGEGSGSEDYYDLIASKAADKKAAKAALTAAYAQERNEGGMGRVVDDNNIGEDGKRAISWMIEKNKASTLQDLFPLIFRPIADNHNLLRGSLPSVRRKCGTLE
jgi:U3 small nucleolar RNA-associated protein 3